MSTPSTDSSPDNTSDMTLTTEIEDETEYHVEGPDENDHDSSFEHTD